MALANDPPTYRPLMELPVLGLSEAFGNGKELPAAEVLFGVDRKLDPAWLTPGDLQEVVDRIVVEQGRVAAHSDDFPPGHRDEFGLVSRPQRPVLTTRFGDHQLRGCAPTPLV